MLLRCPTTSWTKLLKCRPEPDTEEEPLGEGSSQAANAVGVQADESMHDLIPLALRVAEAEGWERSQRNVHGAEIESYQRDMHLLQETWNQKRQDLIRKHTDKIRSMTQRPVYFTQSGKCWRSRVTCLQRFSSTPIIGRAYCTHCSHYLGSTMPFANEDDD